MCIEDGKPALCGTWTGGFLSLAEKNNQHPQKAKQRNKMLTQNPVEEMKPQEHFSH